MNTNKKQTIIDGKAILGIELGSTRIKAVLIGQDHLPLASGTHDWENRLDNGMWTYRLEDVWTGLQSSFASLLLDVKNQYGVALEKVSAMGVSAMMHGYLVFDKQDELLVPFRTWRNTTTEQAAAQLTELFQYNIPLRWNVAHLYQAILNQEEHVKDVSFLTTLSGYVHWKLTGEKVLGVGDAAGMFPIDSETGNYHASMIDQFDQKIAPYGFDWTLEEIFPTVLRAGNLAGVLTPEGAKLLDPSGQFQPGIPFCPPEGDAGTGMVATNSVATRSGNVSAGTSIFAMIVMEKELSKLYPEIDMVTTPCGKPVAMVHCNNCTTDLDAWVRLFAEYSEMAGHTIDKTSLYSMLYNRALEGDADCGGLLTYNYYSGEPITGLEEGRPLFVRLPDSQFSVANLMRSLLFSSMASLRIGMDILTNEGVTVEKMLGHGGLFKTKGVGQRMMAATLNVPMVVMESAGEGGAWGIALLAAFMRKRNENQPLEDFLADHVFIYNQSVTMEPMEEDVQGFSTYIKRYIEGLEIEKAAVKAMRG